MTRLAASVSRRRAFVFGLAGRPSPRTTRPTTWRPPGGDRSQPRRRRSRQHPLVASPSRPRVSWCAPSPVNLIDQLTGAAALELAASVPSSTSRSRKSGPPSPGRAAEDRRVHNSPLRRSSPKGRPPAWGPVTASPPRSWQQRSARRCSRGARGRPRPRGVALLISRPILPLTLSGPARSRSWTAFPRETTMTFDRDLLVIGAGSGRARRPHRRRPAAPKVTVAEGIIRVRRHLRHPRLRSKKLMVCLPPASPVISRTRRASAGRSARPRTAVGADRHQGSRDHPPRRALCGQSQAFRHVESCARASSTKGGSRPPLRRRVITARHVLIATGGTPVRDGLPRLRSRRDLGGTLPLQPRRPDRVVVIGSGYVALEFASLLASLGTRRQLLLSRRARSCAASTASRRHLHGALSSPVGSTSSPRDAPVHLERRGGIAAPTTNRRVIDADEVLLAIGRRPVPPISASTRSISPTARRGDPVTGAAATVCLPWLHAVGDVTDRRR